MEGRSDNRAGLRALALLFLPLVTGSTALLVARLTGRRPPLVLLLLAGVLVVMLVILSATLATIALVRRRWWWGIGLLLAWPLVVPLELWRRSCEAEG